MSPLSRARDALGADLAALVAAPPRLARPLARHTSYRVGGPAEALVLVESTRELRAVREYATRVGVPFRLLGGGTNVLASDRGAAGIVAVSRPRRVRWQVVPGPGTAHAGGMGPLPPAEEGAELVLEVETGANLIALAKETTRLGWAGLHWAAGVPGTVGGAVVSNAGAHGFCLSDVLEAVEVLEADGSSGEVEASALALGYRTSRFRQPSTAIVLQARLRLRAGDAGSLRREAEAWTRQRRERQPFNASAGSVFKNPPGYSAGELIERAGLKGTTVGQARVSPHHANFIVNLGEARAAEVWELIGLIQERVRLQFGIELELEIERVGDW